jgi:hypothetical protein
MHGSITRELLNWQQHLLENDLRAHVFPKEYYHGPPAPIICAYHFRYGQVVAWQTDDDIAAEVTTIAGVPVVIESSWERYYTWHLWTLIRMRHGTEMRDSVVLGQIKYDNGKYDYFDIDDVPLGLCDDDIKSVNRILDEDLRPILKRYTMRAVNAGPPSCSLRRAPFYSLQRSGK